VSETRKLAAILVADIVGYSWLAGADEDRILARLRALRSDLVDPTVAVHHGRVVKRTGDGAVPARGATASNFFTRGHQK
jgi:adenylate cyclase